MKFSTLVPLSGSERKFLSGSRDMGPIDWDEKITVSVYVRSKGNLARLDTSGLQRPQERQYLTHDELMRQFAADPADLRLVEEYGQTHHLEAVEVSPEKRSVKLRGTVADMDGAFSVQLKKFQRAEGKYFRGRTGELKIPKELEEIVEGVFGLDCRKMARSYVRKRQTPTQRAVPDASALPPGTFLPPQVADLYNFPQTATGKGQTIGILTFNSSLGGYDSNALDTYFRQVLKQNRAPKITDVVVHGPGNKPSAANDPDNVTDEVMLDVQVVGSVAPDADIAMYFTDFTEQGWVDALHAVVADTTNNVSVLSISYGNPEDADGTAWTKAAITQVNKAFQAAALKGITICCASGDDGSRDQAEDNLAHADFPASSPFVLGVGGTKITASSGKITSEVVWQEERGAGGGGISAIFEVPDYQKNIPFLQNPPNHKAGRGVPDVAALADPQTGYIIMNVDGQRLQVIGGTSASAPLWAALIARLNEVLKSRIGYFNPVLYHALSTGVLTDITEGNNGAYQAATGWDACTGFGTPDGGRLLLSLQQTAQLATA